ncbi:MAG: hypothetical protein IJB70_02975 [Clostridia bacterium]|nr:hypothetical protein [Clostridia bacterium]
MRNVKSIDYISNLFENEPSMRYDGKEDFAKWQKKSYAKLWELLGLDKMVKCENDDFAVEDEEQRDGYKKLHFTFQTEPGLYTPCYALLPDDTKNVKGVVICIQGHSTGMHISIGEPHYERDNASIAGGDRDFANRAIKEGYAAICMEQRYMGESGYSKDGSPSCITEGRGLPSLLLGRCAIGERVWDVMRLIDVIKKYYPDYAKKIICLGNSGGGTTTFYATCIDERIECGVPSCAVCTYKDSIVDLYHCCCNYIPGVGEFFDMGDLAGLVAPRNMVIVNGLKDNIFPDFGVQKTFAIAQNAFEAAGCKDNVRLVTGPEGHRFYADLAWPVINELMD